MSSTPGSLLPVTSQVADENSQDVGSAFRSGFDMPFERAQIVADLHELSPLAELP